MWFPILVRWRLDIVSGARWDATNEACVRCLPSVTLFVIGQESYNSYFWQRWWHTDINACWKNVLHAPMYRLKLRLKCLMNSLKTGDVTLSQWNRSTSVQVMACRLCDYTNNCWIIAHWWISSLILNLGSINLIQDKYHLQNGGQKLFCVW